MLTFRRSPLLIAAVAAGLALLAGAALAQSGNPPKQDTDRRDPPPAQKAPEPGKPVQDAAGQGQTTPKAEAPKARRGGKDPVREPEEEDDL